MKLYFCIEYSEATSRWPQVVRLPPGPVNPRLRSVLIKNIIRCQLNQQCHAHSNQPQTAPSMSHRLRTWTLNTNRGKYPAAHDSHSVARDLLKDVFPGDTEHLLVWYVPWILCKLSSCTPPLEDVFSSRQSSTSTSAAAGSPSSGDSLRVLASVASFIIEKGPQVSIDAIASLLAPANNTISEARDDVTTTKLNSVFSLLSWLTFIYEPAPSGPSEQIFRIIVGSDGPGIQYFSLSRPHTDKKRKLPYFLKGFGMLLPSRQPGGQLSGEDRNASSGVGKVQPRPLSPHVFNMKVLQSIGYFKVHWTENLPSHLHLNAECDTVSIFKFPSYCLASIPSSSSSAGTTTRTITRSVLHSCATDSDEANWLREWEVTEYLSEVLQSYRLLFGQNKASRDLFQKIKPSAAFAFAYDPLLDELCSSPHPVGHLVDREAYPLLPTFPFLGGRIQELQNQLDARKPRTWGDLWRDRRDSAQWMTFWTVLIFGGIGITLNLLSFIVGFLQLWRQWG
ncbi:hypothetical protein B0T24DRAFT_635918 [Lasiosphaeria ovina]|uniref:Transmembrane protein n=1 Tax=Lasiosphaeria ovina TaxID=92902 RepID=A0AAE0JW00_9PEZI|nr:hypothetical protein B0T24DRAFT_635918 [Lasiosphaeria ovina]